MATSCVVTEIERNICGKCDFFIPYFKLSCRRETARLFVLLNILLSHSRSLNIIRNNLSFTTGFVPNMLKIAKVCPIYKNGDKTDINNYRPISVLPSFSKIYEKLVYNRLSQYAEKFCILNDCQFGFRNNRSTSMAVLEMTDKITKQWKITNFQLEFL